jgi:hypothetical protein
VQALFTFIVVIASYLGHKYFSFARGVGTGASLTPIHDPAPVTKDG